jgi:hypothetical protein
MTNVSHVHETNQQEEPKVKINTLLLRDVYLNI